ncbi:MAG: acyltransferase [Lachnospiraceae bacterium]|nr:acyltransferase [Lachnospiraceae bacterium]
MSESSKTIYIIDILRFVACLMIFFYHCNTILPGEYKFLTFFGNDMGNNLFFMISGFSLCPSIAVTPVKNIHRWYFKRLRKILPLLAAAYILSYLLGYYSLSDPSQLAAVFIYPTLYWFATGILVFYLIMFLFMKIKSKPVRVLILVPLFLLWVMRLNTVESYYFIGFISMASGCMLREGLEEIPGEKAGPGIIIAVLAFAAYMFCKGRIFSGSELTALSVATGVFVIVSGCAALYAGYAGNQALEKFFSEKRSLAGVIRYTGNLALPVYLVQCFGFGILGYTIGERIKFPLSFLVNFLLVWGLAIAAERLQALVVKAVTRRGRE